MSDSSGRSGGIGFSGLLTIVFIVLKLTGNIDWPWWWVLSPAWITASIALTPVLVALLIFAARDRKPRWERRSSGVSDEIREGTVKKGGQNPPPRTPRPPPPKPQGPPNMEVQKGGATRLKS